jgi:hypothetical protein
LAGQWAGSIVRLAGLLEMLAWSTMGERRAREDTR